MFDESLANLNIANGCYYMFQWNLEKQSALKYKKIILKTKNKWRYKEEISLGSIVWNIQG